MYVGQIYYNDQPITVAQAIIQNLVIQDENGDIWLTQDASKVIKIQGNLHLQGP